MKNNRKIVKVAALKTEKTFEHLQATKQRLKDVLNSIEDLENKIQIFTKHL